eukprot:5994522-Lingulodinium_polyedra.AAC.1
MAASWATTGAAATAATSLPRCATWPLARGVTAYRQRAPGRGTPAPHGPTTNRGVQRKPRPCT